MAVRRLKYRDVQHVTDFLLQRAGDAYPLLTPDPERTKAALIGQISRGGRTQLLLGSFATGPDIVDPSTLDGVLIATSGDNVWARKRHAVINAWIANKPGTGAEMMRIAIRWFAAVPAYRMLCFYPDCDMDARVFRLLERLGFQPAGRCWMYHREF